MARNDGVDETAGSESYKEHGQRVQGMLVGFVPRISWSITSWAERLAIGAKARVSVSLDPRHDTL